MTAGKKRIWGAATALALVLVLPVVAQESLLPEGFGDPAPPPAERPTPAPTPAPGPAPVPSAPITGTPALLPDSTATADVDDEAEEGAENGILRYDLPPGARRSLDRIGPLTPETGGMDSTAFGVRGQYAARIMAATRAPIASRWASITLRRAIQ